MATIQSLNEAIDSLKSQIANLQSRYAADRAAYNSAVAANQLAQAQYAELAASGLANPSQLAVAAERVRITQAAIPAQSPDAAYVAQRQVLDNQLLSYQSALFTAENPATTSTGTINLQATAARDEKANKNIPQAFPVELDNNGRIRPLSPPATPSTNAIRSSAGPVDLQTDSPFRPLSSTQAVPPANLNANAARSAQLNQISAGAQTINDDIAASETLSAGIARGILPAAFANSDDGLNVTRQTIVNYFGTSGSVISPEPNVLSKYSSYTYSVSIYLMSPEDAKQTIETQRPLIGNSQLLIQSGGAPLRTNLKNNLDGTGTATVPTPDNNNAPLGRNPEFLVDYYIDDIKIKQYQPGKGSRAPNGITDLDFTITEPNGITLLDNLYQAVEKYVGSKQNYARQTYLMVIRFYGYDEKGNLVLANNNREGALVTDPTAVIEKFIPFQFVNIKFRIANKMVEYNCSARVPQNNIGTSQPRGVIPYNVESNATTVGELLGGTAETQTTFTPQKANAAPQPVITTGIIDALNLYERKLVDEDGKFTVANEYEIVFTDPILSEARLMPTGSTQKALTSTTPGTSATQQISGAKQSVNNESRKISAIAGTSLIQFIDQVLRSSQYIFDQQTYIIDPETGETRAQGTGQGAQVVAWYRIATQVVPIAWDPKRLDYAYKITYQISPYLVNDLQSAWFPQTRYRGIHKRYSYWFTGENTEVLNYEQDFNYLYYIVVAGDQLPQSAVSLDWREAATRQSQPNSNESNKGLQKNVNEPGANAAERLYSLGDLAHARMTILGDPAWIFQGDVWKGISGPSLTFEPFFADGTINHEIQEALFEISFNKPADYSLETGIIDPSGRIAGGNKLLTYSGVLGEPGQNAYSFVYRVISVTSTFSRGKFTQDLEGAIVQFPLTAVVENSRADPESVNQLSAAELAAKFSSGAQAVWEDLTEPIRNTLKKFFPGNNPNTPQQNNYTNNPSPASAPAAQPATSGSTTVGVPGQDNGQTTTNPTQIINRDP